MTLGTLLLIILVVLLVGSLPRWGFNNAWGYGPTGGITLVLAIVLILMVMKRL